MEFSPYVQSEQYKCGAFLEGRVEDKALNLYYDAVDQVITWLSSPFPHADLLSNKALTGEFSEWEESFRTKHNEWLTWQLGWVIVVGIILAISVLFPIVYILYRCCLCCCSSSNPNATDKRLDGCKRNLLNICIAIFIIIDVFAAATVLVSSQYAQYGLVELPNRLSHCVDDLQLYKRDTDTRIRKLLIDDYQTLNKSMNRQLAEAGQNVVNRVKKLTGAQAIDTLLNISSNADNVKEVLVNLRNQVNSINEDASRFEVEFARLKKTATDELLECVQNEVDAVKAVCHRAEKLFSSINTSDLKLDTAMIPLGNEEALDRIINANISKALSASTFQFSSIEESLQREINSKIHSAQNTLRQIGDDLFVVAETISTQIRQVNFDELYNTVSNMSDEKKTPAMRYAKMSWIVSLIISGVFILLAAIFLFGLIFGICGRRPTYYNDDCCVRSNGSRFFSCGIWLTLTFFTVLSVFAAFLLFFAGNTSYLVCQPLRDPLSRPDVMSLAERYIDMWKAKRDSRNDFNSLFDKRTAADVIRACSRNETFYEIFEFDKKYHLNQLKDFEKDAYGQLEDFLSKSLSDLPPVNPISGLLSEEDAAALESLVDANLTRIGGVALNKLNSAAQELDLMSKSRAFQESIENTGGRPKVISSILEQIEEIDFRITMPLRKKLMELHHNITELDKKFSEMQIPVSTLLSKLRHAQALLMEDVKSHFEAAAREELNSTVSLVDQYVQHVRVQMQTEISSCKPIAQLAEHSTAALCNYTIDPLNGTWMAMIVSLICLVFIVFFATSLINLYNRMHSYPKYVVEPPLEHHMSSFITDTYDTRQKPAYSNYSYTDDYHRTYR